MVVKLVEPPKILDSILDPIHAGLARQLESAVALVEELKNNAGDRARRQTAEPLMQQVEVVRDSFARPDDPVRAAHAQVRSQIEDVRRRFMLPEVLR